MREIWQCEKSDDKFHTLEECTSHEEQCGDIIVSKWCYKSNKTEEWKENDVWSSSYSEGWHAINFGRMGYGSGFDGSDLDFEICDACLGEFVNSFSLEGQEKIHNSGSNTYLSTEDWLRVHRNEMPDEEMEEKGMYSPRQRKAYAEKFPVCANVYIKEYSDGNRGSWCIKNASGLKDGSACSHNISVQCFECNIFKVRNVNEEITVRKID